MSMNQSSTQLALATLLLAALLPAFAPAEETRSPEAAEALVPPTLVEFVEAPYPESEMDSELDAVVVLQLSISETGAVVDVGVIESGGEAFDLAAMEAARQFVFEPATSGGAPIPVRIGYRYQFIWEPLLELKSTADFVGVVL